MDRSTEPKVVEMARAILAAGADPSDEAASLRALLRSDFSPHDAASLVHFAMQGACRRQLPPATGFEDWLGRVEMALDRAVRQSEALLLATDRAIDAFNDGLPASEFALEVLAGATGARPC